MTLEANVAERIGIAAKGTAQEVRDALSSAGLPVSLPDDMGADQMMEVMRADKKARGGSLQYALPRAIGEMAGSDSGWTVSVDDAFVREVLT